jgi:hypothetical protein
MTPTQAYDEERIGRLVGLLPPAPQGWARAAQEIPVLRRSLDEILARAEADAAFRPALIADLEAALAQAGYEPEPRLVDELRKLLAGS